MSEDIILTFGPTSPGLKRLVLDLLTRIPEADLDRLARQCITIQEARLAYPGVSELTNKGQSLLVTVDPARFSSTVALRGFLARELAAARLGHHLRPRRLLQSRTLSIYERMTIEKKLGQELTELVQTWGFGREVEALEQFLSN